VNAVCALNITWPARSVPAWFQWMLIALRGVPFFSPFFFLGQIANWNIPFHAGKFLERQRKDPRGANTVKARRRNQLILARGDAGSTGNDTECGSREWTTYRRPHLP